MTATTCGRVQSLGSTCRFFGASCAGACASADVAAQINPIADKPLQTRTRNVERAMVVISCCEVGTEQRGFSARHASLSSAGSNLAVRATNRVWPLGSGILCRFVLEERLAVVVLELEQELVVLLADVLRE